MKNISYEAILLNMKYPSSSIQPRGDSLPDFRDIFIRDVHCEGASDGIKLTGLSGKNIEDIYLRNISGRVYCGMKISNVKNVFLENIQLFAEHDTAMYFNAIDSICFNNVDVQNDGVWAHFSNTDKAKVFTKNVDEDFIKSLSEVGLE